MTAPIKFTPSEFTVSEYIAKIDSGVIDLQPDFQRNYIWDLRRKQRLVDSLLRGYPIPPIWLWQQFDENGHPLLAVIDGQQRLSCINEFRIGGFPFAADTDAAHQSAIADEADGTGFKPANNRKPPWKKIPSNCRHEFLQAVIPHVLVTTNDKAIAVDVFKRLNQGSQVINEQELRNAVWAGKFKTFIYETAESLKKDRFWGQSQRVFKPKDKDRMEVERNLSELLVSLIENKPLNKSDRLDHWYEVLDPNFPDQSKYKRKIKWSMDTLKSILPPNSRFLRNVSDFYTATRVLLLLQNDFGLTKSDKRLKDIAAALDDFALRFMTFESDLKTIGDNARKRLAYEDSNPVLRDYRNTIQGPQREKGQRQRREDILLDLMRPVCERAIPTDPDRLFPDSVKRLAWAGKSNTKGLADCGDCGTSLSFEDAQFDHIEPWSKGGRSTIDNCQILCGRCNRKKGAKRPGRKKAAKARKKAPKKSR